MSFQELEEILLLDKPSSVLRERKEEIARLIPEFDGIYGLATDSELSDFDVFEHTLVVVDGVKADLPLRLAALFHDIGKNETMSFTEDEELFFPGHDSDSDFIFIKYQDCFSLSEEDKYLVRKLITFHEILISPETVKLFLCEFSKDDLNKLYSLKRANILGYPKGHFSEQLKTLEESKQFFPFPIEEENTKNLTKEKNILLLAALCNHTNGFSFKSKAIANDDPNGEQFLVGIATPEGYYYERLSMEYWDYFQCEELQLRVSQLPYSLSDNHKMLKSYALQKTKSNQQKGV